MIYDNIKKGKFIDRPNRFIANIEIDGRPEVCHVKNTGRCKELLLKGADVYVQEVESTKRKTKFDLISVYKGDILINIDSQIPNRVFHEWAKKSNYFGEITCIKPEYKYKNSRFDFFVETPYKKILVEVKGVTLEENGIAKFPDAPTIRGVKHVKELMDAIEEGYEAYIFFIIQMKGVTNFTPNYKTHKDFGDALHDAVEKGLKVIALDSIVTPNNIAADKFIEIRF